MATRFFEKIVHRLMRERARRRTLRPFDLAALEGIKRILLMTTTAIGDTLFSTPAIRAVKETYPDKEVHILGHVRNQFLLQENPYIDHLLLYHGKRKKIATLFRQLKEQRYDLVIILHSNDPEALPLAWATGAPFIIGPGTSRFAEFLTNRVYCTEGTRHAIEQRLDFVRVIGADTINKKMDLFLPPTWAGRAGQILGEKWSEDVHPLIGVHPTGSGSYKWWPHPYFKFLLQELHNRYQARFVLFSSGKEAGAARSISENLEEFVLLTEGKYNLLETAALMKKCRLFIANDSGPLHMALALGLPTLALIGADSPLRIGPYEAPNSATFYRKEEVCSHLHCLNQGCRDNRCLQAISPEEVLSVIESRYSNLFGEGNI